LKKSRNNCVPDLPEEKGKKGKTWRAQLRGCLLSHIGESEQNEPIPTSDSPTKGRGPMETPERRISLRYKVLCPDITQILEGLKEEGIYRPILPVSISVQ